MKTPKKPGKKKSDLVELQKDLEPIVSRIESEIHDSLNQVLFVVQLKLNILERGGDRQGIVTELNKIIAEIISDLKGIAENLQQLKKIIHPRSIYD